MEVIEGQATRVESVDVEARPANTPFHLRIEPDVKRDEGNLAINLDESGWMKTYAEWMRLPGHWFLVHTGSMAPVLALRVNEGDQPYFTKRHIGSVMGPDGEIICFGIGKKSVDGTMVRLWILPNGMICGGDDVDDIGVRMLSGR